MNIPESIKNHFFNCTLPAYILDENWHFVAMNTAFRCLIGEEWDCEIGTSVFDVVEKFDNKEEILQRADILFGEVTDPQVDHEYLRFTSTKYGKVEAQKIAAKIPGENGKPDFWVLQINILSADNFQELFDDMLSAIEQSRHKP